MVPRIARREAAAVGYVTVVPLVRLLVQVAEQVERLYRYSRAVDAALQ